MRSNSTKSACLMSYHGHVSKRRGDAEANADAPHHTETGVTKKIKSVFKKKFTRLGTHFLVFSLFHFWNVLRASHQFYKLLDTFIGEYYCGDMSKYLPDLPDLWGAKPCDNYVEDYSNVPTKSKMLWPSVISLAKTKLLGYDGICLNW